MSQDIIIPAEPFTDNPTWHCLVLTEAFLSWPMHHAIGLCLSLGASGALLFLSTEVENKIIFIFILLLHCLGMPIWWFQAEREVRAEKEESPIYNCIIQKISILWEIFYSKNDFIISRSMRRPVIRSDMGSAHHRNDILALFQEIIQWLDAPQKPEVINMWFHNTQVRTRQCIPDLHLLANFIRVSCAWLLLWPQLESDIPYLLITHNSLKSFLSLI